MTAFQDAHSYSGTPPTEHNPSPLDQTSILLGEDQLSFPAVGVREDLAMNHISHVELHTRKAAKEKERSTRPRPDRLHTKADIDKAVAILNSAGKPVNMEMMVIAYIICRMRQIWDLSPAGNA